MSEYYDPDHDARPQSPFLQVVRPRATPSPSPPPLVTPQPLGPPAARYPRSTSPRRYRKSSRRRNQPSQGDYVLIRTMDPSRLDIARRAGEEALPYHPESDSNPPTDTGSETGDDDMEDQSSSSEVPQPKATPAELPAELEASSGQAVDLQATALRVLETQKDIPRHPPPLPRDSVIDLDGIPHTNSARRPLDAASLYQSRGEIAPSTDGHTLSASSLAVPNNTHGPFANGFPNRARAPSPHLGLLKIPQRTGSPSSKLPALLPDSPLPAGPLPSLSAVIEQQERESASFSAHRPSIASSAHSPTSNPRQLSIGSALSPGTPFPPLTAASPLSASGERDIFPRTSSSALLFGTQRRPSQTSDSSPYSATLHSGTDSYHSPGGISPGTQPAHIDAHGARMSIDGALIAHRTLPRPLGLGMVPHIPHTHIPPHGTGEFKCDHPGCKAPPFQTQYLLNSHANVHSSSRPHYCPVPGCSRAEGGKGFKRKNEMIRHGLVHSSPGYICPFCPEREHRYPRPDNLQRHVRVHHEDKNKDDPKLREVLSQRPEGGSRGRRRRLNS